MATDKSIVVLGGGTAGWLTAGLIAARLTPAQRQSCTVTLVESPTVPILGVGEGTWPTMRHSLRKLGVREADFLRACDASFKQGSQFIGWRKPAAQGEHRYLHPFMPPHRFGDMDLAAAWLAQPGSLPFDEATGFQAALCAHGLAPKTAAIADYEGIGNYGYHFDAGKLATFLSGHVTGELGVRHIVADMVGATQDADGYLTGLQLADGRKVGGDLFVDCSGGRGALIGDIYGVGLVDCRDTLFVDTALAVPVGYDDADAGIASATLATAQAAGWIWDIGLTSRRGIGYVYASRYASEDEAIATLEAYVRQQTGRPLPAPPRRLAINSGYREQFWVRNCVAIGIASGFVEPLEASSIAMIETSAQAVADSLTFERAAMAIEARRLNTRLGQLWREVVDFIKLHYVLSDRTEPFWQANRDPGSIPASLAENLVVWRNRPPGPQDFPQTGHLFGAASHQFILYGMGFGARPELAVPDARIDPAAQACLDEIAALKARFARALPPNRDVLRAMTL